ncbi:MAG: beta-propeller fold lactonase family protein [Acidobacteria bacterium]|jgi:hypothetical protein|nr:beta-propeller fold lactonase family protein [Bryobacteraceae bacterium CoA2 C42]
MRTLLFTLGGTLLAAFLLVSQSGVTERVGPRPDGAFLLNSGALLTPAGRQQATDTFPMASALSPDKRWLLVLHGGYNPPAVVVFDAQSMTEKSRVNLPDAWLGLTFSPNGKMVYVGGGSQANVHELSFDPTAGALQLLRSMPIVPAADRKHTDFIGDVALSPDGRLVYAAALFQNAVHVINPQSGRVIETWKTGRRPYRILFHPDGQSFFVSHWADASVGQYAANTGVRLALLRAGQHPTDMLWSSRQPDAGEGDSDAPKLTGRLFVTNGNANSVTVIGVNDSNTASPLESINVSLSPEQPAGMTPSALALSPDQKQLYVVCSDANAVAVADISRLRSQVRGFIPTGWYPLAARALDSQLLVFNGRGPRSYPNPKGPNPTLRPAPVHEGNAAVEYVGRLQRGSVSVIPPFDDAQLETWTTAVRQNLPYNDRRLFLAHSATTLAPILPLRPGDPSRLEHVIYIVKENRTYDQVLGDLGKGNGDPSLTLFPERVSPNHHKLAREFVLLDNFYVSADVSADGHNWTTAGIAPDYVQRMWPNSYAGRRKHYDYEGGEPAALPPAGYLWNNALAAGRTVRNYGYFVENTPLKDVTASTPHVKLVRDPALLPHTNRQYRGFDMDYPDVERAKSFLADLANLEAAGKFPHLSVVRLGNDHTSGLAAGKISPLAAMADNDYALGLIVEGLSKSKFWEKMAIFVIEDDAQNGPDHVDSHRSPAFVISPYTKRGAIDSSFYNTTSMLRTIELILGIRPMTTFDAGARPMTGAFQLTPNVSAYSAEKPRYPLDERNPGQGALAARSARMDFDEADEIDDDELNAILWTAIKKTTPPVPVRSYFGK